MIKYILRTTNGYLKVNKTNTVTRTTMDGATIFDSKSEAKRYLEKGWLTYGTCKIKELECKEIE